VQPIRQGSSAAPAEGLSARREPGRRLKTQSLILKRAPIGWNQDDYDVVENGVIVGRIFLDAVGPRERPWMWASGHNGDYRRATHGYEPTREAAMAAFSKSWRRS
jgi:hypothetical protein